MNVDIIVIGCISVLGALYALFNIFGIVGLGCGIALISVYAMLLKISPRKPQEKSTFQNIKLKLPIILI